jgi:hypothetical protein
VVGYRARLQGTRAGVVRWGRRVTCELPLREFALVKIRWITSAGLQWVATVEGSLNGNAGDGGHVARRYRAVFQGAPIEEGPWRRGSRASEVQGVAPGHKRWSGTLGKKSHM